MIMHLAIAAVRELEASPKGNTMGVSARASGSSMTLTDAGTDAGGCDVLKGPLHAPECCQISLGCH